MPFPKRSVDMVRLYLSKRNIDAFPLQIKPTGETYYNPKTDYCTTILFKRRHASALKLIDMFEVALILTSLSDRRLHNRCPLIN